MKYLDAYIKRTIKYFKILIKWLIVSLIIGAIGGFIGSFFHISIDFVTNLREKNGFIILFLPIAGLIIAGLYHLFQTKGKIDTNQVIEAVRNNDKVPFVMMPLIFISTVITHMFGGSSGREGAALQLGGSLGYNLGKVLKFSKNNMRILIMSGMSSVFSALFGTPLTAAVFSMEVTNVGEFQYAGIVPCVFSSIISFFISQKLGLRAVKFDGIIPETFGLLNIGKIIVLALLCAIVSIIFCMAIKKSEFLMSKLFKNRYVRAFIGGLIIVGLTILVNSQDYNGAGMNVITRAMTGSVNKEAFILKIVFTALTVASGFKGGEIVPAFFVGATFGSAVAPILGINPMFAAAVGMITLFCCVVNCPIASILLSLEVFGAEGLVFFAIAVAIGYMMSGNFGLYNRQKILYSKLDCEVIDKYTR